MKNSILIIYFVALVQWAGAQDLWKPDMNFQVRFSSITGESSNVVWWGLCGYNRFIRVPAYIPGAPTYTNDLEVNILFAELPDAVWILEKDANGNFKTITEITNGVNGENYNYVIQRFTLTKKQVHSLIKGNWYLEADYVDNIFISKLEPQYEAARGPTAVINLESPFFEHPYTWIYNVIARDNKKTTVVLDASQSTDCFYLPMQFDWFIYNNDGLMFSETGATVSHVFALGHYTVILGANDSVANGKNSVVYLNVITAAQAVDKILSVISYLPIPENKVKKLREILLEASKDFDHGRMVLGCARMSDFKRQVRLLNSTSESATWVLQEAQKIIDSINDNKSFRDDLRPQPYYRD